MIAHSSGSVQLSLDDLGTDLRDVTFVVVDLETTGGDTAHDGITEIGAVKVRGGEVLGEFQTLIDPQRPIPAFIASLTGISDRMVAGSPTIDVALPMFLDFAAASVLVAHNARFDLGFLKAAAARIDLAWPGHQVVDTVGLARKLIGRDEVRNHKLSTLAAYFRCEITPNHRALADARATVGVLDGLLARLGSAGSTTLEDLAHVGAKVRPVQRQKRHLAENLPSGPGVYRFVAADGEVLYVGRSADVRSRVRTYFTPAEKRRHVLDMLPAAERVEVVRCLTETEAAVRELRMIAELRPRGNRRSRHPVRVPWLKLNATGPLLRTARAVADDESRGCAYVGPLTTVHDADRLRDLLLTHLVGRAALFDRAVHHRSDDALRERLRSMLLDDPRELAASVRERMVQLAAGERYEDAAALRDAALCLFTACARAADLRGLAGCEEIIAARPVGDDWELLCVRWGRLAGTSRVPRTADVLAAARTLRATAADCASLRAPLCSGYHEEAELLLAWLGAGDCRIVDVTGTWGRSALADHGAALLRADYAGGQQAAESRSTDSEFQERAAS